MAEGLLFAFARPARLVVPLSIALSLFTGMAAASWFLLPRVAPRVVIRWSPWVDPVMRAVSIGRQSVPSKTEPSAWSLFRQRVRRDPAAWTPSLSRALRSEDGVVRALALEAFRTVISSQPSAVPALLDRLRAEPDDWKERHVFEAIWRQVGDDDRAQVYASIADDPRMPPNAVRTVVRMRDLDVWREHLRTNPPPWRSQAASSNRSEVATQSLPVSEEATKQTTHAANEPMPPQ